MLVFINYTDNLIFNPITKKFLFEEIFNEKDLLMAKLLFVSMDEISEEVILNESKEIFSQIENINYKATTLYENKSRYFNFFDEKGLNPEYQKTVVYLCNEDTLNLSYKIVKSPNGHGSNYDSFLCSKNELESLISKFNLQKIKSVKRRIRKVEIKEKKEKSLSDIIFTKMAIKNFQEKGYDIYDFCILENGIVIGNNGNIRSFNFSYKGKKYRSDIQWFKECKFSQKFLFDVYAPEERIFNFLYTKASHQNFKSSTSSLKRCMFDIIDVEYDVKETVAVKSVKIFCKITEKEFTYSACNFRKAMMSLKHKQAVSKILYPSLYQKKEKGVRFDYNAPAMFYYFKINKNGIEAFKPGITNANVKERHLSDWKYITVLYEKHFNTGREAQAYETEILRNNKKSKLKGHKLLTHGGNSELMRYDILGYDNTLLYAA